MLEIVQTTPVKFKYNLVKMITYGQETAYLYYDEDANRNFTMGYHVYEITKETYEQTLETAKRYNKTDQVELKQYIGYLSADEFKEEVEWLSEIFTGETK